jgi:hypothetical protein
VGLPEEERVTEIYLRFGEPGVEPEPAAAPAEEGAE